MAVIVLERHSLSSDALMKNLTFGLQVFIRPPEYSTRVQHLTQFQNVLKEKSGTKIKKLQDWFQAMGLKPRLKSDPVTYVQAIAAYLPLSLKEPFVLLKGSSYSFSVTLSIAISWASCSLIYFAIVASFKPTVLT